MTTESTAKALILFTRNLHPDAIQLAHVLLANDESLPPNIKHGLRETLLKIRRAEPMTRLGECVAQLLALSKLPPRSAAVREPQIAVWAEIDKMEGRAAVSNVLIWFSAVCNIVAEDDQALAVTLH